MNDDLEPLDGPYDWAEAARQNPGADISEFPAEAEDQMARAAADEIAGWLAATVADLGADESPVAGALP